MNGGEKWKNVGKCGGYNMVWWVGDFWDDRWLAGIVYSRQDGYKGWNLRD